MRLDLRQFLVLRIRQFSDLGYVVGDSRSTRKGSTRAGLHGVAKGLQTEPGSPDAFGLRAIYARPRYNPRA